MENESDQSGASNANFQELIENLNNPEKVQEATTKKIDIKETYQKVKQLYQKISHDDYYSAKNKLDQNVELKKSMRDEIRKIELMKDKATLTDEEEAEVTRINNLIESQNKTPEKTKLIIEKMNKIEESLKEFRIAIMNLSE